MTQRIPRRSIILAILLLTALALLAFAFSGYPGISQALGARDPVRGELVPGLRVDNRDVGVRAWKLESKILSEKRWGRPPDSMLARSATGQSSFRVSSEPATVTVHVPLVLRNWPAAGHAVSGTEFAPRQEVTTSTVYVPLLLRNWSSAPDVVWGTEFAPWQEENESTYAQITTRDLAWVQRAGFTSIRTQVYWREIEPANTTPDAYAWSQYDQRLLDYRNYGLDPVVGIVGYPLWATHYYCGGGLLAGMDAEWREFVRALARRYSAPPYEVHIWEIGNEVDGETAIDPEDAEREPEDGQNQPTWPFGGCWGDMAPAYVEFLRMAYQEIKAVDPEATVMMGGLAYAEFDHWFIRDFFDNFLAAGGGAYTDVVGFHWFPFRQSWSTAAEKAQELRDIMAARGVSKPLWLTETYMWDREDETDTRDLQVTSITQELPRAVGSRAVDRVYWFGFWDFPPEVSPIDRGLVTFEHEPKPGLKVFEMMAGLVTGQPLPPVKNDPGVEAYQFVRPSQGEETWVLWSTSGQSGTVTLPVAGSSVEAIRIQVGDTYTATQTITTTVPIDAGLATLEVDGGTTFLRLERRP